MRSEKLDPHAARISRVRRTNPEMGILRYVSTDLRGDNVATEPFIAMQRFWIRGVLC
jgi:hypothetical protein